MCILRVTRYVQENGNILDASTSWVLCHRSVRGKPCPDQERREDIVRVPNSPGLVHDASSTASSMPSTPTSGPRFDIREPFKQSSSKNPPRYGDFLKPPPAGRHSSRPIQRPVLSQPNPPAQRGSLHRTPLPTGLRDHRRTHSDSEYDDRFSGAESSDRATEILDRGAARDRARREQTEQRRRVDEARRREEEKAQREAALDEEEARTQKRLSFREILREENQRKLREEDRRRERREREAKDALELEKERQRDADEERRQQLKREIEEEKDAERRRKARDREEEEYRKELDDLLDEERRRRARRTQLERELQYYQDLEARLDHAGRRRAEKDTYPRPMHEAEEARLARESRRAENARLQRQGESDLSEELRQLHVIENRLEEVRRAKPPPTKSRPTSWGIPPLAPIPPRPRPNTYITQGLGYQTPTMESLLRQQPESIQDPGVRRTLGEDVLDRARQNAAYRESTERVPLVRRYTIGGRDRARETQYRTMRRNPG